jgi:hypothetical protein
MPRLSKAEAWREVREEEEEVVVAGHFLLLLLVRLLERGAEGRRKAVLTPCRFWVGGMEMCEDVMDE